jgi:hypothetical protein
MTSHTGWKDRISDFLWGISGPFSIGIYMGAAMVIAFLASADPPERLSKLRERQRRASQAGRAAQPTTCSRSFAGLGRVAPYRYNAAGSPKASHR